MNDYTRCRVANRCHETTLLLQVPLLSDRAVVIVSGHIVAPPLRERDRGPTRAKYRERQDEQASHTRAIKCTSDQVRIVLEDARSVVAEVELRVESDKDPTEQHACLRLVVGDVAGELNELREIDLVDGEFANLRYELDAD
jgi:hypothetical protein